MQGAARTGLEGANIPSLLQTDPGVCRGGKPVQLQQPGEPAVVVLMQQGMGEMGCAGWAHGLAEEFVGDEDQWEQPWEPPVLLPLGSLGRLG